MAWASMRIENTPRAPNATGSSRKLGRTRSPKAKTKAKTRAKERAKARRPRIAPGGGSGAPT